MQTIDIGEVVPLADGAPTPEMTALWRDETTRAFELIAALDGRQRMAVMLRHFEECSLEEIAAQFGSSIDVAKNTLYRAHRKLHALWLEKQGRPVQEKKS